jgi:hypothetical protein
MKRTWHVGQVPMRSLEMRLNVLEVEHGSQLTVISITPEGESCLLVYTVNEPRSHPPEDLAPLDIASTRRANIKGWGLP